MLSQNVVPGAGGAASALTALLLLVLADISAELSTLSQCEQAAVAVADAAVAQAMARQRRAAQVNQGRLRITATLGGAYARGLSPRGDARRSGSTRDLPWPVNPHYRLGATYDRIDSEEVVAS
jgi:hypothetical protein